MSRGMFPFFAHRTVGFWVWLAAAVVGGATTLSLLVALLAVPSLSSEEALATGARIIIRMEDGAIQGKQAPSAEEEKIAAAVQPSTPTEAPPAAPAELATNATAPSADRTPEADAADASPTDHAPSPESSVKPPKDAASEPLTVPTLDAVANEPAAAAAPTDSTATDALIERTDDGALPKVGADGRLPRVAYALPAEIPHGSMPKIALIVLHAGLNSDTTAQALTLPKSVALSVSPYAEKPDQWLAMVRNQGHEAYLDLPLEPQDYPVSDAGAYSLTARVTAEEQRRRLHWVMSRAVGYVGLVGTPNDRFLNDAAAAAPALEEIGKRGVLLLTSNPRTVMTLAQMGEKAAPVVHQPVSVVIDATLTPDGIAKAYSDLLSVARRNGSAVGVLRAYPLTLDRTRAWLASLPSEGAMLVPPSALAPAPKETIAAAKATSP